MENTPEYGNLRLAVKDFGPIARAEIDLRPLTVFIGPSNTGKSYLSILIYALHSVFQNYNENRGIQHILSNFPSVIWNMPGDRFDLRAHKADLDEELTNETVQKISRWITDAVLPQETSNYKVKKSPHLPDQFTRLTRKKIREIAVANDWMNIEVCRCFGIGGNIGHFKRYGIKKTPVFSLRKHIEIKYKNRIDCGYDLYLENNPNKFSGYIPNDTPLYFGDNLDSVIRRLSRFGIGLRTPDDDIARRKFLVHRLVDYVAGATISSIVAPLNRPAFYLPADRAGVMHAHRSVVAALIESASRASLRRPPELPLVSGVLADFLEALITMGDRPRARRQRSRSLASDLEKSVLGGTVQAEPSETRYPSFSYRPHGWKADLPLMTTSSMVSELAPLVLYLRHLVREGDTLIIEEPESHLHPELQAAFARHLARLAGSGIRVIVTTHSEWLLDQFANLVRMSALPETAREGLPGADAALSPDQFGAWLFKPRQSPRGSVVEEIRIDPDAGGLTRDYSDTADQLFGNWLEIGNRIADRADTNKA